MKQKPDKEVYLGQLVRQTQLKEARSQALTVKSISVVLGSRVLLPCTFFRLQFLLLFVTLSQLLFGNNKKKLHKNLCNFSNSFRKNSHLCPYLLLFTFFKMIISYFKSKTFITQVEIHFLTILKSHDFTQFEKTNF